MKVLTGGWYGKTFGNAKVKGSCFGHKDRLALANALWSTSRVDQKQQFQNALSHLQSGNLQMAAELCDLNLKKYPGDANFLCLSAKANIALRNFGIAESRLEEAIKLFPEFPVAHETLGDLLIVQGRGRSARAAYERIKAERGLK